MRVGVRILKANKTLLFLLALVIAGSFAFDKRDVLEIATEPLKEKDIKATQPKIGPLVQELRITYVVDGDTVEIETGERVRLVGIDAPESGEPYFSESRAKLEELVLGVKALFEKDARDKDNYGRLLRYIYRDELFVNLEMVRLGYARALIIPPDVKYKELFLSAASEARRQRLGLWAAADN